MIGMVDYHIHSILSDGHDSYEDMVHVAISKGLYEIGFTDHVCLKPVDWAIRLEDIPLDYVIGSVHFIGFLRCVTGTMFR